MLKLLQSLTSITSSFRKWNDQKLLEEFATSLAEIDKKLTNASRYVAPAELQSRVELAQLVLGRLEDEALLDKLMTPLSFVGDAERGSQLLYQADRLFDILFDANQRLFEIASPAQLQEFLQHYKRSELLTELSVKTSVKRMQIAQKISGELLDRANDKTRSGSERTDTDANLVQLPMVGQSDRQQQFVLTLLRARRTRIEAVLNLVESNRSFELDTVVAESEQDSFDALLMLRMSGFNRSAKNLNLCATGLRLLIVSPHPRTNQGLLIGSIGELIKVEMNNMLSMQINLLGHAIEACEEQISVCKRRASLIELIGASLSQS